MPDIGHTPGEPAKGKRWSNQLAVGSVDPALQQCKNLERQGPVHREQPDRSQA